jgi:hypothetical protein
MRSLQRLSVIAICLFLSLACHPQAVDKDQITGTIQDPSGALVANANVTATQTDTGFSRSTIAGSTGSYVLSNLPVGPYRIEVSAAGFKTSVQKGIVLQVNVNPTINVTLEVGAMTQQVEVKESITMTETQTAAIGQVINAQSVVDLPLNGRNPAQLVLLSGGATMISGYIGSKNYPTSETISVSGGTTNGTDYLMDGGYHQDVFSAVNLPIPFPDLLQEFSVQTSSIPASYGERAGGVVNIITKSGTNDYHGDLFEFVRNGAVNATNYFATKVDKQKRNQFGGTAGGPIKHDKLFFFGGWQETILRTAPPTSISFTPTAAELAGNFSAITTPIINPATGAQFPGNQIPTSMFSLATLNLLKFIPVGTGANGEVLYSIPSPSNENQYLGRVDWNKSSRDAIFGRYYYTTDSNPAAFGGNLLLTTSFALHDTVQALVLGDTYALSPTSVNALHFTWTQERINRTPAPGLPSAATLGLSVAPSPGNSPWITVTNYFTTMCQTCAIASIYSGSKQVADDFNLNKGRHLFQFGVDWVGKYLQYTTSTQQNASYTFDGSITGNALSDLMLGLTASFQAGNITKFDPVMNYFGIYGTDSIKLSRRLTVNAGLRWEPYLPEHDTSNRASHFDLGAYALGTKTSVYVNAPPGFTYPGDKGFPVGGTQHALTRLFPRVGLIWDLRGNANTIVHVGYGILGDGHSDLETFDRFGIGPPWGSWITINDPTGGWANPFQGYPGGDPFPLQTPITSSTFFPSEGVYVNVPLQLKVTYFQEWNVSIQRQIGANWLFTANYVGNHGTHLWIPYQADPAVYISGQCGSSACSTIANTNSRRVLTLLNPVAGAAISSMGTINDGATSSYHGMLLSLNRRLSRNFSLLFNYTLSHCINTADEFIEIGSPSVSYQNPYDLEGDRGNCGSDVRQIYNMSLVAGTPHWTGNIGKQVISDWHLALIVSGHSGSWFSPTTGSDTSLTGVDSDRPNVSGNANSFNRTLTEWFNKSLYSKNLPGTYGNAGRNSLLGPGGYEPDLSIYRDFPYEMFHKTQLFEIRAEAFDVINHPTFTNPTSTLSSANFGRILSANNPRIMQFVAKYVF